MTDKNSFTEKLHKALCDNSLSAFAIESVTEKLYLLTERMLAVNEYMNLTAICELDGIIMKHYVDSLTAAAYMPEGASVIDIGCGAGFPSLPLAIARPDLHITALDSTAKRINYIRETAQMLAIDNIDCITARAEELAHDSMYRERFDISCARAVARLNVLCELCLPFVKQGGYFLAMKGAKAMEEAQEAQKGIAALGARIKEIRKMDFDLPDFAHLDAVRDFCSAERYIIIIEKTKKTPPQYPRAYAAITKKPL